MLLARTPILKCSNDASKFSKFMVNPSDASTVLMISIGDLKITLSTLVKNLFLIIPVSDIEGSDLDLSISHTCAFSIK